MPTTLYFAQNTAFPKGPGTYPTLATQYANLTQTGAVTTEGCMLPYTWRAVANLSGNSLNNTTAQRFRFGRFFSAPFAQDYTWVNPVNSAGAIKFFLSDFEANLSANHAVQSVCIYVWRPSTGTRIGYLSQIADTLAGAKEPTAINAIQNTLGEYFTTAGNIAILAGDILVFEPFGTFTQAAATAYNIRFYYGGVTAITTENTAAATPASRVDFPYDLPLLYPPNTAVGSMDTIAFSGTLPPLLVSRLNGEASIIDGQGLVDGSRLRARLQAKATFSPASLNTRVLLNSGLHSIATLTSALQQRHELQTAAVGTSESLGQFESRAVGDLLSLYYSGSGSSGNPGLSLGGARGAAYGDQQVVFDTAIPGLQFIQCSNIRSGPINLVTDPIAQTISWVIHPLLIKTSYYGGNVDTVFVGDLSNGFLVFRVTDKNAVPALQLIANAVNLENTLFANPSLSVLASGETVYRALFLMNYSAQDIELPVLSLDHSSIETISIGTEYVSNLNLTQYQRKIDVHRRGTDVTGRGDNLLIAPILQISLNVSPLGNPTMYSTIGRAQETDGISTQLPTTLVDQFDSTLLLSEVQFGPTLSWPRIKAGKGVSFWVRKVQPPGVVPPVTQKLGFKVTGTF